jgi:hypothetical protein
MKYSLAGIETLTISVDTAGARRIEGKIALPRPSQGAASASQIVATIKQNGTTLLTTTPGSDGFSLPLLVAIGDSITVQLTSSQAEDEVLNAVNAVVSF